MDMKRWFKLAAVLLVLTIVASLAPSPARAQATLEIPYGVAVFDSSAPPKKVGEVIAGGPGAATVALRVVSPSLPGGQQVVLLMVGGSGFNAFGAGFPLAFLNDPTCSNLSVVHFIVGPGGAFSPLGSLAGVFGANQTLLVQSGAPFTPGANDLVFVLTPPPGTPACLLTTQPPTGSAPFQCAPATATVDLGPPLFNPPFNLRAADNVLLGF